MPQYSDDLFLGSAVTNMGTGLRAYSTTATGGTGGVSSSTLTITALNFGAPIVVGMFVDGTSVTDGTFITAFGTGTGGIGTYTLNQAINIANSTTLIFNDNEPFDNPSPMSIGVGPLGRIYVWDVVPQALGASNVAAVQTTSSAIALTAGTSVKSVINASGATVLQLDCPRALSIVSGTGTLTDRNVTITGFDYYGQPMSEVIATGTVQSTTVAGKKAFFQIASATISGALGATIAIGTTDTLGLPVRVTDGGYICHVGWAGGFALDTGTFAAAATVTATTTTGDVRGTFDPSSAADGIKRLVLGIMLPAIAVGPNATRVGALGVNQNLVS
jgi:hypothetical protein